MPWHSPSLGFVYSLALWQLHLDINWKTRATPLQCQLEQPAALQCRPEFSSIQLAAVHVGLDTDLVLVICQLKHAFTSYVSGNDVVVARINQHQVSIVASFQVPLVVVHSQHLHSHRG